MIRSPGSKGSNSSTVRPSTSLSALDARPGAPARDVASDLTAQGVVNAPHRLGCSIPDDIAVGGFDDSPAATAVTPALTTVRQPFERISTEMVRMLLAQIAGEDTAGVILPTN